MERNSCIFYKSFYDSIKELDAKDQVQIYNAIFEYQFENNLIELNGVCKSIFTLIIPQLEANNKRYENGKKGGRPKTKTKPNNNQNKTEVKPNVNDNVNVNNNDNNKEKINKKEKYGTFENVKLTIEEYQKLKDTFPDYQEKIENLSYYLQSKGDKYKSHYATILNWSRKEQPKKKTREQEFQEQLERMRKLDEEEERLKNEQARNI